jgi:hypothetical protein
LAYILNRDHGQSRRESFDDKSTGPSSVTTGERFDLVYLIYYLSNITRLLSLDGRPLQIYEDDVEIPWPGPSTEPWIPPDSPTRGPTSQPEIRTMQYVIPVIRIIPQLKKTLKSPTISRATLDTYDAYFRSILSSYPENLQINVDSPLEPCFLHAVIPLQVARQLLYRHNMTPQCSVSERKAAIDRSSSAAEDTLTYIKRCFRWRGPLSEGETANDSDGQEQLRKEVRFHANNFVCMHIWRTTLIFCLKQNFQAALICAQLSKIIGDMRLINIGCGRYLSRFLQRVKEECTSPSYTRKGNSNNNASGYSDSHETDTLFGSELDESEEIIAYASGDLQADPDNAWIWARRNNTTQSKDVVVDEEAPRGAQALPTTALLTDVEKNDWGGWDGVEKLLSELVELQQKAGPRYYRPAHNPHKRVQLEVAGDERQEASGGGGTTHRMPASAGASRISIANII